MLIISDTLIAKFYLLLKIILAVDREGGSSNVDNVLIWCQGLRMRHADYVRHKPSSRKSSAKIDANNPEKAKEYSRLVGKTLSEKMLLVRV